VGLVFGGGDFDRFYSQLLLALLLLGEFGLFGLYVGLAAPHNQRVDITMPANKTIVPIIAHSNI
jgi:hypothetical protein